MKAHYKLSKIAASLAVVGGISVASSQIWAAVTPLAGTNISNVATATYTDNTGVERVVTSNEVKTIVAQVGSFTLEANRTAKTTPNGQVTLPHILQNTGNGTDKFNLSLENMAGDDFDFAAGKHAIYIDRNKDGVPDDTTDLNKKSIELLAGESVGLVIVATTPSTVIAGKSAKLEIKAESTNLAIYTGGALTKTNMDTVTITTGAVMQISKSASVSTVESNGEIAYTLEFKNTGNDTATNVAIFDILPATVDYVAGSARYNGGAALTDSIDTVDTFYFDTETRGFLFNLASVPANTTGKLTFKVKVKATATAGNIQNIAFIDPDGKDGKQLNEIPTSPETDSTNVQSNPSIVSIVGTYAGAINDSLEIKTLTGIDDQITLVGKQGLPVVFGDKNAVEGDRIVVHNNGNIVDTYNLSYDKSALPTGSVVEILKVDGYTPVVDTNGDGDVDTGPIEAGKSQQFVVRITLSNDTVLTESATVILKSTSIKNKQEDTMKLTISSLSKNIVDLVSKTDSGVKGTGNSSEVGYTTPYDDKIVDKKTTLPATPTTFDITIKNQGNIPDNYNITVPNVPAGWTVEIFEKNGDVCTSSKVSNSGNIKQDEDKSFCVTVTPPADSLADIFTDLTVKVASPATVTSDDIKFKVTVAEQRQLTFNPDNQGQVAPGGTIVYKHVLKNTGNVTEADAVKYPLDLIFTSTMNNVNASIYVDIDNDGTISNKDQISELVTGDDDLQRKESLKSLLAKVKNKTGRTETIEGAEVDLGQRAGLQPFESVNIIIKIEAPATATSGEKDTTTLTFIPSGSNAPKQVSITDLTTVTIGQIRLVKEQGVGDCTASSKSISYSIEQGKVSPGQCVYYRITATNEGNAEAKSVVISDMVPNYTTLKEGSVSGELTPKDNSYKQIVNKQAPQISYVLSKLNPGSVATLYFAVKVDLDASITSP